MYDDFGVANILLTVFLFFLNNLNFIVSIWPFARKEQD